MKSIVVILLFTFSANLYANSHTNSTLTSQQSALISDLFEQLIKYQVNDAVAIERSVSSLLKHYPEQIDFVLNTAIDKYPHEYKQIICGALKAEPALAVDVITIMLAANVADSAQVVGIAIKQEPAYAKEIVSTAVSKNPKDIDNIVRIALLTEPVIAKNVVDDTMLSYPEKLLDILTTAITALPDQVVSIVSDTLRLFPDDANKVVTTAVSSTRGDTGKVREIIAIAIQAGLAIEQAKDAAIAGGANTVDVALFQLQ